MKELDNKYKNKLIYAFYGMGKSHLKNNKDIYETDDILCKLFRCHNSNLYNTMSKSQKDYPDVYEYTMNNLSNYTDMYLKKGGTVLTSNNKLLSKADYIFLPTKVDIVIPRLADKKRSNSFNADINKLNTKYKQVETYAKNNNIEIIYTDKYLFDYLFS